jgi:hypothetical protein
MMVHFEHTNIALRAVMAPIWLGLETPLTHADPTVLLALKGQLEHSFSLLMASSLLLIVHEQGVLLVGERSSLRSQILVVIVAGLSGLILVLKNLLVSEISNLNGKMAL